MCGGGAGQQDAGIDGGEGTIRCKPRGWLGVSGGGACFVGPVARRWVHVWGQRSGGSRLVVLEERLWRIK